MVLSLNLFLNGFLTLAKFVIILILQLLGQSNSTFVSKIRNVNFKRSLHHIFQGLLQYRFLHAYIIDVLFLLGTLYSAISAYGEVKDALNCPDEVKKAAMRRRAERMSFMGELFLPAFK